MFMLRGKVDHNDTSNQVCCILLYSQGITFIKHVSKLSCEVARDFQAVYSVEENPIMSQRQSYLCSMLE